MALEMKFACFEIRGQAQLSTSGFLDNFLLEANNPMCFADMLLEAILGVLPDSTKDLIGEALVVRIRAARIFYGGSGSTINIDLDLDLMEQRKLLSFTLGRPVESARDLVEMIMENAMVILEALDDILNVFSLTFLDVTLGHKPVSWANQYGDSNFVGTGKGVTAGGALKLANQAWARIGFFGGGFGVDMDNYATAGGNLMGSQKELFHVELALKLDATIRNPIASDIAETIADALESIGLKDLLEGIGRGSVSKDSVDEVVVLRNAACDLKERLAALIGKLNAQLGDMSHPKQNQLGVQLPRILEAMSQLMIGILETMQLGDVVQLATGSRAGLGALRELLQQFTTDAASFFGGGSAAQSMAGVESAASSVRKANLAMILNLRQVPTRIQTAIRAIDVLIFVLEDEDTASRLQQLSGWGTTMRNLHCLLKKAPDISSRIAYIEYGPRSFGPLRPLSQTLLAPVPRRAPLALDGSPGTKLSGSSACHQPALPAAEPASVALASRHFPGYDGLCGTVQQVLVQLATRLGATELPKYSDLTRAVGARQLSRAARLLERCSLCASDEGVMDASLATFCRDSVAVLNAGCSTASRWIDAPDWAAARARFVFVEPASPPPPWSPPPPLSANASATNSTNGDNLTNASATNSSSPPPPAVPPPHAQYTVTPLDVDFTYQLSGRAQCSSSTAAVQISYRFTHRRVSIAFYTNTSWAPTDDLLRTTAGSLYLASNGQIAVRSDQVALPRWWAFYEPVFMDASVIESAGLSVSTACGRHLAAHATMVLPANTTNLTNASATNLSSPDRLDLVFEDAVLALPRRSPPQQTLLAAGLSDRPWPVIVPVAGICQAHCHAGLSLEPLGDEASLLDISSRSEQLPSLTPGFSRCLQYHRFDYASCGISKAAADQRLAGCLDAPSNLSLADGTSTTSFTSWLTASLVSQGIPENETAIAAAGLDCEAFVAARTKHCSCAPSADEWTPQLRTLSASVGMTRDHRASNRPHDVVALRERLWSLGYGRASFSTELPADSCDADLPSAGTASDSSESSGFIHNDLQERLTRVLLCAAAGVLQFEDPCDLLRVNGSA
jgi:hypothetical protein